MFRVTAWEVKTDKFNGLVYTQKIVLDKMAEAEWFEVNIKFFIRTNRPMDHVTYQEI